MRIMGHKISYGNEHFGIVPIVEDTTGKSLGTPIDLTEMGLVSTDATPNQDENIVYADDRIWARIKGTKNTEITLAFKHLLTAYLTYLGYKIAANGGISDTGAFPAHAVFWETLQLDEATGVETRTLHYYYNCVASTPTKPTVTTEDIIDAADIGIVLHASNSDFVVDADGTKVSYFEITRTDDNKALYDTFLTAAITPTSEVPTPPTPDPE